LSPRYLEVRLCVPGVSFESLYTATPDGFNFASVTRVAPSKNCTVPVGVWCLAGATVTVIATGWFKSEGFGAAARLVLVERTVHSALSAQQTRPTAAPPAGTRAYSQSESGEVGVVAW
jgi:hypothetical protein